MTDHDANRSDEWVKYAVARDQVRQFNDKHGIGKKNQALQLGAESGELQDAVLKDDVEGVRGEIGDTLFVAYSLAELYGVDPVQALHDVALENSKKDAETEGDKVSKSTDGE